VIRRLATSLCVAGALTAPAAQAAPPRAAASDLAPDRTFGGFELGSPGPVARTPSGDLVVVDAGPSPKLDRYSPDGAFLGSFTVNPPDRLRGPQDVAADDAGNVFVPDVGLLGFFVQVAVFDRDGRQTAEWDGSPAHPLFQPDGIGVRGSTVYVSEPGVDRIAMFTPWGGFLGSFGAGGSGAGQLSTPAGLDADDDGKVYVADSGNDRIEVFDASGAYVRQFGAGRLRAPARVTLDGGGHLDVSEFQSARGLRFRRDGTFLGTFGPAESGARLIGVAADGPDAVYATEKLQGVAHGQVTRYAPRAEASHVTAVNPVAATLHGIVRPGGVDTSYEFRWHRLGHGHWHGLGVHDAGNGATAVPVSARLPRLAAHREYVVRLRVDPAGRGPEISNDVTFTTHSAPPPTPGDLTVGAVTGLRPRSATLNADVTGHGGPSAVRARLTADGRDPRWLTLHSDAPLTATTRPFSRAVKVRAGTHYTFTVSLVNPAGGPVTSAVREFTTP
jgi:hypothetical protein